MYIYELYDEIDWFINKCEKIYLYGAGDYGRFMCEYVIHLGKVVSGFIETKGEDNDEINGYAVYSAKEMQGVLSEEDGVIMSLSEKNQGELDGDMIGNWHCNVLWLKDFQLYEVKNFGSNNSNWERSKNIEINEEKYIKKKEQQRLLAIKKREELQRLQRVYHFADWHVNTDNAYGVDVAKQIDIILEATSLQSSIYEVGCGLCNILGNPALSKYKRVGIDRAEEVLQANKVKYGDSIEFRLGSFEMIDSEDIDVLVTVNFMNSISKEEIQKIYAKLFQKNNIRYYLVDEVTGEYMHHHRFKTLLPDSFELVHSLGPYPAANGIRYIRFFENNAY